MLKLKYTFLFVFNWLDATSRPPPPSCSCPPPLTGGMRDNGSASRNTTCCSHQPPDERPHDLRLALKTPKKEKEKKPLSLFPPSFVPQLRVCVGGKDESVHSEQMSLNLELLQPVADTLGSSPRSGGGGGAAEMLREADGWRDGEPPASPDVFVSLAGGWPRRGEAFSPPFFFFFSGGGVSIRYSLLPLSPPFNRPLTPFPNPAGSCFAGRSARSRETGAAV